MADPSSSPNTHRIRWRLLALFAVFSLLVAACGGDDADTSDTAADATASDDAAAPISQRSGETVDSGDSGGDDAMEDAADEPADAEASAADNDTGSGGGTPPPLNTQQLGREIIFTATINVGVDDVAVAGTQATDIITDIGGFVFGQNTVGGAEPRSTITFKVRPEDFSEALSRLGGIGELRNQTVTTDDVTERVVDLNSRIEVAELGVNRLREAMENTSTLTDFAELEGLLLSRESDLEVMRGQLRTLRDRIDLATITLTLEQDRVVNSIDLFFTVYEGHDDGLSCPGRGANEVLFEPGDEITLCFESRNSGDQPLSNIAITETVLGLDNDDLFTVFGETEALQPGQTVIQGYELTAERDRPLRVSVTATPTDGVSDEPAGPAVRAQGTPALRVNEDAVDPGFGDGFDAATSLLKQLWIIIRVLVGFIIPLLILLPIFWILWIAVRRLGRWSQARNTPAPPPAHAKPSSTGPESAPAPVPAGPAQPADDDQPSDDDD